MNRSRFPRLAIAKSLLSVFAICSLLIACDDQPSTPTAVATNQPEKTLPLPQISAIGTQSPMSPTSTATATVAATATTGSTATPIKPSPTATTAVANTAVAPTVAPAALQPRIIHFTASPTAIQTGDPITLSWDVAGVEGIEIYSVHSLQRFGWQALYYDDRTIFPPSGSLVTYAPSSLTEIGFTLAAPHNLTASAAIDIACRYNFFVDIDLPYLCPKEMEREVPAAIQRFERGFMVWHSDLVFIFVEMPAQSGHMLADYWEGEEILFNEPTPNGRFLPQHGFGKIWVENEHVRQTVGWAVETEMEYTAVLQETNGHYFFSLPNEQYVAVSTTPVSEIEWAYARRQ